MKKRTIYSEEPIEAKVIDDTFLPRPEDLVLKDEKVKVTIALSKNSIDFFKEKAQESGTSYQKMIRNLLDMYVQKYQSSGG